ncbi:hypothetical protein ACF073_41405 [Streptomyces sp. NPDC015171]|uniref:hypothetical protein n=1 Tax=Streptomyces sp. NPDC015171 TaxID=3364945 RepID=UPI0036FB7FAE
MTDNWQQKPEYKADVEQAQRQAGVVDQISRLRNGFRGTPIGAALSAGRTNFEDHDLNAMIDLVHHSNPEHLETASKALWDARTAIHDAATDLKTNLGGVDWQGDGAEQFQKWTNGLIEWTKGLATFADVAATEISSAATGLASVRNSMPDRDPRPAGEQKRPDKLPKAKQVDGDPDYATALKVEKDRQEAINQVNRLASFYSVSATALGTALQTDPQPYTPIPDVGVPKPSGIYRNPSGSGGSIPSRREGLVGGSHGTVAESHHRTASTNGTESRGHVSPVKDVHEPSPPSGRDVGTEINTTTTLPPQTPAAPPSSPSPTLPTTGGSGQVPPLPTGPVAPPVVPTSGRTPGYGPGGRPSVTAQGRTGPSVTGGGRVPQGPAGQAGRTVAGGRVPQGPVGQQGGRSGPGGRVPQGPMGQAARAAGRTPAMGQQGGRGPVQSGRSPVGRPVTGGTPRTSNTPGRAGVAGPSAAARNGVVGGKPVTGRVSGGSAGPRVPRGTVVGAEEPASSATPKGALGQRGVVGAPGAKTEPGAGQAALRSAGNPKGVIGSSRDSAKGSEPGGAGLGRGAVGGRQDPGGEAGRAGRTAGTGQHRSSQQRRDVPKKSD